MMKATVELEAFEVRWMRDYPLDSARSFRLVDAMYDHARKMGAIPILDPREGLEDKIKFARAMNGLRTPSGTLPGI